MTKWSDLVLTDDPQEVQPQYASVRPMPAPQAEPGVGRFEFKPPSAAPFDAVPRSPQRWSETLFQEEIGPAPAVPARPSSQSGPRPDTGTDALKSFAAGVVRGGVGMASLPATTEQLYAKAGERLGLQGVIPEPARKIAGAIADSGGFWGAPLRMISGGPTNKPTQEQMTSAVERMAGPLYEPQTLAGEYARTVGEFLPGAASPGGVVRKAANVVLPGVASEGAGQLAKGTELEPWARLVGGIGGAMVPNIAARAVTPFPNPSPERARQAAVMDREGVPLTAGERTGRRSLRWAESVANDVPMAGQRIGAQKEVQGERFTQAAMRRAGITDAALATDEVVNDAFNRLGNVFNQAGARASIPPDPRTRNALERIVVDYENVIEPMNRSPLPGRILEDFSNSNGLTGQQYLRWRSDLGRLARKTENPFTRDAIYDMQHVLDDAAETMLRSTGRADLADDLLQARNQYRNLLMIAEARAGAGENAALGSISPQKLQEVVRRFEGKVNYARGRGDLTELANAGVATMFPLPNSGTPARLAAMQIFNLPATVSGALAGGPVGGLLAHGGAAASQAAMARMLMSAPVQGYLGNQTLARAVQNNRARTPLAIGGLSTTIDRERNQSLPNLWQ